MRKSWRVVFILIVLLSLGSLTVEAQESETEKLPIEGIRTAGNRSISTGQILSRVRSRVGQLFERATAAEDARRIAELAGVDYAYYNTEVVDNRIQLTFVVVERNIVRSIVFVGNRRYKAKRLRGKLGQRQGDYLDPLLAEAAVRTLTEFYRSRGFAFIEVALDKKELDEGRLIYTISEGPRVRVGSVSISGNNTIKAGALKKAVKTKTTKWFIRPANYVEERVAEDVARLQDIYMDRGFLDADIASRWEFTEDRGKVHITFVVEEGPVYTIEEVVIAGNEHFDGGRLQAELKSELGQVYSERKANSDVKRLLVLYRENGFIDVNVKQSMKFVSEGSVEIKFQMSEGERFRIGRVDITGNEQTQDKVIRRVLDEYDFQPGRWYNADVARGDGSGELERKIRRMALLEAATVTPGAPPGGEVSGRKDAQVSVIEGKTGMVMLGAGVASDSGIIGQFIFEQRNFDIKDWPESFSEFITGQAFKGAGQDLRIALQPGTEVSEYSVSFSEPYFRDKPMSLDVVGSSYERDRESYDEQRAKGYVGFERRYKDRWRRSIGFRFENVDVADIESSAPKEITDVKGDNVLAGVRIGIGRDLTDDRFNPSRGYSFNVSYEQAGGDHTFGLLSGTHRRYKVVYEDLAGRRTILATKLHAATVLGDAPPFEKFYAGGQGSIRGFDYRGVSTRGINPDTGKLDDPIGSDWVFLAGAEVTVPLVSESFAALFFVDSGAIDSGSCRVAVGMGIQILIPQWFGPVPMRFELASPVMKDDNDDVQVFSFSVGRLF